MPRLDQRQTGAFERNREHDQGRYGGATYQYSFNNGLYLSNSLEAAHFAPDNKKL